MQLFVLGGFRLLARWRFTLLLQLTALIHQAASDNIEGVQETRAEL